MLSQKAKVVAAFGLFKHEWADSDRELPQVFNKIQNFQPTVIHNNIDNLQPIISENKENLQPPEENLERNDLYQQKR